MPTSGERKALWFFTLVALSGAVARVWRPGGEVETPALEHQLRRVDSVRAKRRPADVRREPTSVATAPRPPLDMDRATPAELERLPGIGPALAARIVANRDSAGPFGVMEAVCDVRGVGPALAEKLRPLVTFSGPRRPVSVACGEGSKVPRKARAARGDK